MGATGCTLLVVRNPAVTYVVYYAVERSHCAVNSEIIINFMVWLYGISPLVSNEHCYFLGYCEYSLIQSYLHFS